MVVRQIRILDWCARAPAGEGAGEWVAHAPADRERAAAAEGASPGAAMPMMLRRRLSPLGQQALAAAYEVGDIAATRYLFCSRYGDYRRTLGLLGAIVEGAPASPTEFTMSVHNALPGLLSIATANRAGHTAIAAAEDSFASGLIEAIALVAVSPTEQVLLVYYDEPLPAPYESFNDPDDRPLALCLLLTSPVAAVERGELVAIEIEPGRSNLRRPTTAQAFDFLRFLSSRESEACSAGARIAMRWRRAA